MMRSNCTNNHLPDGLTYEQTSNPGANYILNEKVKRVLCLMSNTGGGHKASAQALKDGFESIVGKFSKFVFFFLYLFKRKYI